VRPARRDDIGDVPYVLVVQPGDDSLQPVPDFLSQLRLAERSAREIDEEEYQSRLAILRDRFRPLNDLVGRIVAAVSTGAHATRVPLTTLQRSFLPKLRDCAAAIDAELRTVR
jgi:DNA-binding IclR family transcriptional regulator